MYVYHDSGKIIAVSADRIGMKCEVIEVPELNVEAKVLIRDYTVKQGRLVKRHEKVDIYKAKIAFVSVWGIQCGISTYSEFLVKAMRDRGLNVRVFAEKYEGAVDSDDVLHCWTRGTSLLGLCDELKAYDPDFIYVQHEYGIFPDARHWTKFVSFLKNYNYNVAFHSVYTHKDKTVCEAICDNVVVHSEAAKDILEGKGIKAKISVIPHGCVEGKDLTRLWNIYKSPYTFMQFGFGFEYKGWNTALNAVKILKETYPDVFYLMLFSESEFSADYHQSQFFKIQKLVQDLGIGDNVSIIRGFQPEDVIDSFLRTVRVAVFPYTSHPDHVVYGSTGAARIAMANGTPVVTSKLPLFYDLRGVVPQITSAEELAVELDRLFSDKKHYEELRKGEIKYVKDNSWAEAANKYLTVW